MRNCQVVERKMDAFMSIACVTARHDGLLLPVLTRRSFCGQVSTVMHVAGIYIVSFLLRHHEVEEREHCCIKYPTSSRSSHGRH